MIVENRDEPLGKAIPSLVYLSQHTVAGDKRDLHAAEIGGEEHRHKDANNEWYINGFCHQSLKGCRLVC